MHFRLDLQNLDLMHFQVKYELQNLGSMHFRDKYDLLSFGFESPPDSLTRLETRGLLPSGALVAHPKVIQKTQRKR